MRSMSGVTRLDCELGRRGCIARRHPIEPVQDGVLVHRAIAPTPRWRTRSRFSVRACRKSASLQQFAPDVAGDGRRLRAPSQAPERTRVDESDASNPGNLGRCADSFSANQSSGWRSLLHVISISFTTRHGDAFRTRPGPSCWACVVGRAASAFWSACSVRLVDTPGGDAVRSSTENEASVYSVPHTDADGPCFLRIDRPMDAPDYSGPWTDKGMAI